jgi:SAM-dependent methyltransferase
MTPTTAGPGGYDATYVRLLPAAEDRHFWFRARNAVIAAVLSRIVPALPSGYRALEIGCGTGNTLRVLESACRPGALVGMDAQYEGLAVARRRVSCPLVQADIRQAPFAAALRFDLVGLFDVLEHIPDDGGALSTIRTRMLPGARLLLTVPAGPELWSAFDVASRHCRRYTPQGLRGMLTSAGFEVEYLSPFMAALYPLAWVKRRWTGAHRGRGGDPVADDLRIVPVVNGALAWLLGREARLIAAGRSLPFGTSLLAVARRL